VRLFGGINEIGGNKFLLEDGPTRVFLDFGLSYAVRGKYFEEYLKPSACAGMVHLVRTGLLPNPLDPDFANCYRSDYLEMMGLKPRKEPSIHGVFISHIHYDHSAYAAFLHEDVPLYGSPATIAMAEALSICGRREFEHEIFDFKRRPILNPKTESTPRKWVPIEPYGKAKIDGLELVGLPVDHSVPGAMAYLVHTTEGTVFYTGDLRVEGYGQLTGQSLRHLEGESVDLMLCEGTRIAEFWKPTEEDVISAASALASQAKGMVIADFAFKDLKRLGAFLEAARRSGRKLVLSLRDACLLDIMRRVDSSLPDPRRNPDIELLVERKKTGTYQDRDYEGWEREYLDSGNALLSCDLASDASRRIVHAGFYDMTSLLDFEMPQGSIYIHSASEAHNEEDIIDERRLQNWLDLLGLPKFHVHASGHAGYEELRSLIEGVGSERLVPIHTGLPGLFRQLHPRVVMPALRGQVPVEEGVR
jgi:ribonuclease J